MATHRNDRAQDKLRTFLWDNKIGLLRVAQTYGRELWTAPGAADLTFGSLLFEMIGNSYVRVETLDPTARRYYLKCEFCGGSDEDRPLGRRPAHALVKHDSNCLFAKHLPRLLAMANRDVT